jgi:hypothetical protein
VRHPQTLGQQQFQSVAEPLAPMAQVASLVWEDVLEELFAGEEPRKTVSGSITYRLFTDDQLGAISVRVRPV